jgi:hypothetical protein
MSENIFRREKYYTKEDVREMSQKTDDTKGGRILNNIF